MSENITKLCKWQEHNGRLVCNDCGFILPISARDSTKRYCKPSNSSKVEKAGLKWSYGVTTVESRFNELLPRTLISLRRAGFKDPRLFVDGACNIPPSLQGYSITQRVPAVRTYANWFLSLSELYFREPNADRYAMFQDDFVTSRNLRTYLEAVPYPDKGYLNLYTFPENQKTDKGFYESNQWGRGAVALVFNNEAVRTLLRQEHMINKIRNRQNRRGWAKGDKGVDGGVIESFKALGWKEYVHNPSLVQHTGLDSSMNNRRHPLASSFKGQDFDLLDLLKPPKKKRELGDTVEAALSLVGITSERVEEWIGRPCGCPERKEKLNQLSRWAKRVLGGKLEDAEKHLEDLVQQPENAG